MFLCVRRQTLFSVCTSGAIDSIGIMANTRTHETQVQQGLGGTHCRLEHQMDDCVPQTQGTEMEDNTFSITKYYQIMEYWRKTTVTILPPQTKCIFLYFLERRLNAFSYTP